jgi:mRNA interferase MazF
MRSVRRGEIVALPPDRGARGHEQRGARYGVVLQVDGMSWLSTVIVAPTSRSAAATSFRPTIRVRGRETRLMVDHLRVVDASRLGASQGHLAAAELDEVEGALKLVFGLF